MKIISAFTTSLTRSRMLSILLYPFHLVLRFQLFGHALLLGVFFYQPKKECLCLFLYISEVTVELAGSEQVAVQNFVVLLQVLSAAMCPHADRTFFLRVVGQTGRQ